MRRRIRVSQCRVLRLGVWIRAPFCVRVRAAGGMPVRSGSIGRGRSCPFSGLQGSERSAPSCGQGAGRCRRPRLHPAANAPDRRGAALLSSTWGRSAPQRPQSVAIAYAPALPPGTQVRLTHRTREPSSPSSEDQRPQRRAPQRSSDASRTGHGHRCRYCVRTCDGFFFPLGVSTGSAAGDEGCL